MDRKEALDGRLGLLRQPLTVVRIAPVVTAIIEKLVQVAFTIRGFTFAAARVHVVRACREVMTQLMLLHAIVVDIGYDIKCSGKQTTAFIQLFFPLCARIGYFMLFVGGESVHGMVKGIFPVICRARELRLNQLHGHGWVDGDHIPARRSLHQIRPFQGEGVGVGGMEGVEDLISCDGGSFHLEKEDLASEGFDVNRGGHGST